MLMLIDDFTHLDNCEKNFLFETYESAWSCQIPVKLPTVNKFTRDDLEKWIKQTRGIFDPCRKHRDNLIQTINEILANSDNGSPDESSNISVQNCVNANLMKEY